jgi:hypothetical protein
MSYRLLPVVSFLVASVFISNTSAWADKTEKPEQAPAESKAKIVLNCREHTPEYSYEQWDKKVTPVKAGLMVEAPSGKGGFGANNLKVDIDGNQYLEIAIMTWPQNAMRSMTINLVDLYGSEVSWSVTIDQIAPGKLVWFRFKLAAANLTLKGKRKDFDYTDIKGYQIKGDWSEQPAHFTVIGLQAKH